MEISRYRPSGIPGALTVPLFALATGAAVLLAWVYQFLTSWIPFIQLNALIVLAYAGAVAGLTNYAARKGLCRSRAVAVLLALPVAAVAVAATYYWGWQSTIDTIAKQHPDAARADIAARFTVWRWMDLRIEHGWKVSNHGSGGSDFTGWAVIAVWSIEGLAVLAGAVLGAWAAASAPFCEPCGQWAIKRTLLLPGLRRDSISLELESGDLAGLVGKAPLEGADGSVRIALTAEHCKSCLQRAWLTVEEVLVTQAKGKTKEVKKTLLAKATMEPEHLSRLLARLEPQPAPATAAT
jgi:hypothetical protein